MVIVCLVGICSDRLCRMGCVFLQLKFMWLNCILFCVMCSGVLLGRFIILVCCLSNWNRCLVLMVVFFVLWNMKFSVLSGRYIWMMYVLISIRLLIDSMLCVMFCLVSSMMVVILLVMMLFCDMCSNDKVCWLVIVVLMCWCRMLWQWWVLKCLLVQIFMVLWLSMLLSSWLLVIELNLFICCCRCMWCCVRSMVVVQQVVNVVRMVMRYYLLQWFIMMMSMELIFIMVGRIVNSVIFSRNLMLVVLCFILWISLLVC